MSKILTLLDYSCNIPSTPKEVINMMTERDLRGLYDLNSGHGVPPSASFHMRMSVLGEMGRLMENLPDSNPVVIIESRIGRAIQETVRAYVQGLLADTRGDGGIYNSRGERVHRLPIGGNIGLDLDETELYRSSRERWGHTIGNPPLNPVAWLRHADGILRTIGSIRVGERFRRG